jgi:hypothetical protein
MSPRSFEPKFMKLSVLTAALQELTPRSVRDRDADQAVVDGLQFAREASARPASSRRWGRVQVP